MSKPTTALKEWEIERLREIERKWYDSFYSVIFTPPGEIPQTKGHWTDTEIVAEMLAGLKKEYPPETVMLVVSSRCGDIHVESAEEWLQMREIQREEWERHAAYVKAGVCSQCGACSRAEAETKCRPSPLGDTGDYTCDGEGLWEDEES